jgi:protein-tyrosine sulfotransferase
MTALQLATVSGPGDRASTGAVADGARQSAPLVVLTYAHAGFRLLGSLLSAHPDVVCTAGTGMLPLCQQAIVTWQHAEGRAGQGGQGGQGAQGARGVVSPLAASSVRAMMTAMTACMFARSGKSRWCEISFASPEVAGMFGTVYPDTRFYCLHRTCSDVISGGLRGVPWDLSDDRLAPYIAAHPGNEVAALAAYWVTRTRALLAFEAANPLICQRVRYEDLAAAPAAISEMLASMGLRQDAAMTSHLDSASMEREIAAAGLPGCGEAIPAGQIPPSLRAEVNDLLARLAYPPLAERASKERAG